MILCARISRLEETPRKNRVSPPPSLHRAKHQTTKSCHRSSSGIQAFFFLSRGDIHEYDETEIRTKLDTAITSEARERNPRGRIDNAVIDNSLIRASAMRANVSRGTARYRARIDTF